jgi:acetyl esterase/lipase
MIARLAPQMMPDPSYVPPDLIPLDALVDGPHGDVPVKVYLPSAGQDSGPYPLVVWCHGGGWIEGGHATNGGDPEAAELCARVGAVVVSPDYRLATEGIWYPLPVDDVLATWAWALQNCTSWGATAERTAIGGGSAGGNIAAGVALRLRDEGGILPSTLILNVAPLHTDLPALTDAQRESFCLNEISEELWRRGIRLGLENYLGAPASEAPIYVAPGTGDPSGLPPTLLITAEYDILRISSERFARSLDAAGVPYKLVVAPGVGHGHTSAPWLKAAQDTFDEITAWLATV